MKKSYLTFLFLSFFIASVFAQPRIAAQADIGGTGDDRLVTMCRSADGGLLAVGYSNSNKSSTKSESSKGNYDFWVVKSVYDKTIGKVVKQWDKTIGGDSTDVLIGASSTRDSGFILAGYSFSGKSGDKSEANLGGWDVWLVKINKEGNIIWDKTLGTNKYDNPEFIDTTNDGGYILLANLDNRLNLLKLDSAGNEMWRKSDLNSGTNGVYYTSVHQTSDGGYLFAGEFATGEGMAKTDANLNEQWMSIVGNGGITFNYEARELSDGNYAFFGMKSTSIYDNDGAEINQDYYFNLYKTDKSGKVFWGINEYEGSNGSLNFAFEEVSKGGYLYSYTDNGNSSWVYNYVVKKVSVAGKPEYSDSIITNRASYIKAIKEVKRGTYIYGSTSNAGIGADKTKKNLGENDFWFIEAKDTALTNAPLITNKMAAPVLQKQALFNVYPNPVKDKLQVQVDGKATVSLMDANGKTILRQIIQNSGSINVEKLPAGMYYLKNESTNTSKRVIITK